MHSDDRLTVTMEIQSLEVNAHARSEHIPKRVMIPSLGTDLKVVGNTVHTLFELPNAFHFDYKLFDFATMTTIKLFVIRFLIHVCDTSVLVSDL